MRNTKKRTFRRKPRKSIKKRGGELQDPIFEEYLKDKAEELKIPENKKNEFIMEQKKKTSLLRDPIKKALLTEYLLLPASQEIVPVEKVAPIAIYCATRLKYYNDYNTEPYKSATTFKRIAKSIITLEYKTMNKIIEITKGDILNCMFRCQELTESLDAKELPEAFDDDVEKDTSNLYKMLLDLDKKQ